MLILPEPSSQLKSRARDLPAQRRSRGIQPPPLAACVSSQPMPRLEVISGLLRVSLGQEEPRQPLFGNSHPRVTCLMPQLQLEEAQSKGEFHPVEDAEFQESTGLARLCLHESGQELWLPRSSSWRSKVSSNCGFPDFKLSLSFGFFLKELVISRDV